MKKSRLTIKALTFLFLSLIASGCLTTQYKEYQIKLNGDGSGEGTITFYNIISQEDDGKDVSFSDFGEFVDDYLNGSRFEEDNPGFNVTDKKILEHDSLLIAEVSFTFASLDSIGFYLDKNCECGSIMYNLGNFSEKYKESNGEYLGETRDFPVIVWKGSTKEFKFTTTTQEELEGTHSLLPLYKTWLGSQN